MRTDHVRPEILRRLVDTILSFNHPLEVVLSDMIRLLILLILLVVCASAQSALAQIWKPVESFTSMESPQFHNLSFADSLHGAIASTGGSLNQQEILLTRDGGRSWWIAYSDALNPPSPVRPTKMGFVSYPRAGLIVATLDSAQVTRSVDGGENWERVVVHGFRQRNRGPISMNAEDNGVLVLKSKSGDAGPALPDALFHTFDGGRSWDSVPTFRTQGWEENPILEIESPGLRHYIVVSIKSGSEHLVATTFDGGQQWHYSTSPLGTDSILQRVTYSFVNEQVGYMAGNRLKRFGGDTIGTAGILTKTTDGGITWTKVFEGFVERLPLSGFSDIAFIDEMHGIASSEGKIFRTTTGGETWTVDSIAPHKSGSLFVEWPRGNAGVAMNVFAQVMLYDAGVSSVGPFRDVPEGDVDLVLSGEIGR